MRKNMPITQRERNFPAQQHLTSVTDCRGIIIYCSDEFAAVSGFNREQLIGSPQKPGTPPGHARAGIRANVGLPQGWQKLDGHHQEPLQQWRFLQLHVWTPSHG